jgi:hypothetical protein
VVERRADGEVWVVEMKVGKRIDRGMDGRDERKVLVGKNLGRYF